MDIINIIRTEIERIPDGPYFEGLKSVIGHIDVASRHLARGQKEQDDTAFTDAIYRTNQAFEGSIKEAYRVLAGKEPARMRPHDIEQYLEENKIFKPRVLDQLSNYRKQWRNPSTHDYNLGFDEDEAFLAIVSVSAFAKLLISAISERISFVEFRRDAQSHERSIVGKIHRNKDISNQVVEAFEEFLKRYSLKSPNIPIENESQLLGALSGFLSTATPDLKTATEVRLSNTRPMYADLIVEGKNEKIIVEVKHTQFASRAIENGLRQLESYGLNSKASGGILLLYSPIPGEYELKRHEGQDKRFPIWILQPKKSDRKS